MFLTVGDGVATKFVAGPNKPAPVVVGPAIEALPGALDPSGRTIAPAGVAVPKVPAVTGVSGTAACCNCCST